MMRTPPFNGEIIPIVLIVLVVKSCPLVSIQNLSLYSSAGFAPPHTCHAGGGRMMGKQGLPGKCKGAEEHGNKYFPVYNVLTHSGVCYIFYIADIDVIFIVH